MKLSVLLHNETDLQIQFPWSFDTLIVLSSLLLVLLEVYSPWGLALGLVDIQDCCLMKWLSPVLALDVCPLLLLEGCL